MEKSQYIGITETSDPCFHLDIFDNLYNANIIITKNLTNNLIEKLIENGVKNVEKGVFGADMKVDLLNDGPVTILYDSEIWRRK